MLARYSLKDGGTDANKWLMQMAEAIGGHFAKQEAGTDDDVMRQQQDNIPSLGDPQTAVRHLDKLVGVYRGK